jgi:hypothetical protein
MAQAADRRSSVHEAAARARALAVDMRHVQAGQLPLDSETWRALVRLAERAALWATIAERDEALGEAA